MIDISQIDYSMFDRPEILSLLFHPRSEFSAHEKTDSMQDFLIPVDDDVNIGAIFYIAGETAPNILFFHGNGEIAADYDDIGSIYNEMGVNLMVVDYRGYGRSTGRPTVTAMMRDAHLTFDWMLKRLEKHGHGGTFFVMGRSLGSASVLELAANYPEEIDGLIVESGFTCVDPLLELLGGKVKALGVKEEAGARNIDKIRKYDKPTLIIHAEYDHLIPFAEGKALYDASPAEDKRLIKIPHADHNTIFQYGMSEYLDAIREFIKI
ncbi:alpha/beta hydrolase [Thermodesulfobacteriota bacterium]